MTDDEFNSLYLNKEFRNKLDKICKGMYTANRKAFERGGFFDYSEGKVSKSELIEYTPAYLELQQECLIKICMSPPGKSISYYLKAAQNQLIDLLRKFNRRTELIEIVFPDDDTPKGKELGNLFYSTTGEDEYGEGSGP